MSGKPWTEEETNYLIGHSNKDCAEHLGRTLCAINWKRRKECIPAPLREDRWSPDEIEYLMFYADKMPIAEIAKTLHRSVSAVANKCSQEHISHKDPARHWSKEQDETAAKMCRQGYTIDEIGAKLSKTPNAVRQRCYFIGAVYHTVKPDWRED